MIVTDNALLTIEAVRQYFAAHVSGAYQRDNFDAFLRASCFTYDIPTIHVTGTNGKGSTATMLKNIYQASGMKVGLFTSPALDHFQEMIRINDTEIEDAYVIPFMNEWAKRYEEYHLTTFEMQTHMMFRYFMDKKVDLAVIEVGMGGRLDATNVFMPILSIITNIGLEHAHYLGPTIEDIAFHKGGIIKKNVPVLIGPMLEGALRVIRTLASGNSAPLYKVKTPFGIKQGVSQYFSYEHYANVEVTLSGTYQIFNAALALEATNILKQRYPLREKDIRDGLGRTVMPGRMETMAQRPRVILDGAHNPPGIAALVNSIESWGKKVHILFAAFKDKDVVSMLKLLEKVSESITITSFDHARARRQSDYPVTEYPYIDDFETALALIYQKAAPSSVILLTGSLAFIGAARTFIRSGGLKK